MTSASIMEVQKAGFVSQANQTKQAPVNTGAQFSDAMQFASASQQDSGAEPVSSSEVKTHVEKSAAEHTGRKEIREVDQAEQKAEVSEEKISDEMEAKEEAIVKEIAEKLGVSEEEVREAMEVLGLGVMDLLAQGNMVALAAQLTGMQNVDVLTDENLFAQITELTETVQSELQSVADSLGMSLEQLQAAVEEQMTAKEGVQMPQAEMMQTEAGSVAQEITEPVAMVVEAEMAEATEERAVVEETPETDVTLQEKEQVAAKVTTETEPEMTGQQEKESGEESALMQSGQNVAVMKNDMNVTAQAVTDELFESKMDIEQTRELINQIADHVRVQRSETISSMEIQLHPVELGTVNLQVVAKDGNVSARLAVQDEAVRAALESQVMQLRETLQEQGLKIDAVEVTVATHEFEQNLDQHGREAEENAAKEKKSSRRILDLNEIGQEELEGEEMSDADRLQVEMMRMGGNRLNLRV